MYAGESAVSISFKITGELKIMIDYVPVNYLLFINSFLYFVMRWVSE